MAKEALPAAEEVPRAACMVEAQRSARDPLARECYYCVFFLCWQPKNYARSPVGRVKLFFFRMIYILYIYTGLTVAEDRLESRSGILVLNCTTRGLDTVQYCTVAVDFHCEVDL